MRRRYLPVIGLFVLAVGIGAFLLSPSPVRTTATSATPVLTATAAGTSPAVSAGQQLFEQTCSTCHGAQAQGSVLAPNLRGVGAATVDLWVSSGWMPLANPTSQPIKKPAFFDRSQTISIANFIESLGGGPKIPTVDLSGATESQGFDLFAENCAPCHTITGAGDALSNGLTAPPLHGVAATQVEEAIRTGPGNMPWFGKGILSDTQVNSIVKYVTSTIQHPSNPGGIGLGGVGPVAEGFIGLFIGVGVCVIIALWIGERTERDPEHDDEHDDHEHESDPEVADV